MAETIPCGKWDPAFGDYTGNITITMTDDALSWSDGHVQYAARLLDGNPIRKTYWSSAFLYVVDLERNSRAEPTPQKVTWIWYSRPELTIRTLTCEG